MRSINARECVCRCQLIDLDQPRHYAGEDLGVDIDGLVDADDERLLALKAPLKLIADKVRLELRCAKTRILYYDSSSAFWAPAFKEHALIEHSRAHRKQPRSLNTAAFRLRSGLLSPNNTPSSDTAAFDEHSRVH